MTTVRDLIQMLDEMDGDLEVRVVHQETYPLQIDLQRVLALRKGRDGQARVYLLDAGQPYNDPYGPAGIFQGQLEDEDDLACEDCGEPADEEMAEINRDGQAFIVHASCMKEGDLVA